ncbi:MAG: 2-hydroxyacyl-CoA dehydratase [Spirochaetes bacterium]|nr:2-hydroxyacyl-CoA dehydratase [Spirochaetota bacterium]
MASNTGSFSGFLGLTGYLCPYTVIEIIHAAGFVPVRVFVPNTSRELADAYLPPNFCPYLRHVVDLGVRKELTRYDSIVVSHTCDGARRTRDVLDAYGPGTGLFFLDLPKRDDRDAVTYFASQLARMVRFFEQRSGHRITEKRLREAVTLYEENRRLLGRIYTLRESYPALLSGKQTAELLDFNVSVPVSEANERLRQTAVRMEREGRDAGNERQGKRVFVTGNLLDFESYLAEIEEAGGVIAGDDFCFGGRYYPGSIDRDGDSLLALAARYLSRVPCGRMERYAERFDRLVEAVERTGARGVVYLGLKFCDNFLTDYPLLKRRLDEKGVPSLFCECEFYPAGTGQLRTRVEAFIEMLD